MKKKRFIDYDQKLDNALVELKRKCKCGHTKIIPYNKNFEYVICSWCGARIYRDEEKQKNYDKDCEKKEFMFKLNQCMDYINKNLEEPCDDIELHYMEDKKFEKKRLKRKYFKDNGDYFNFCNDNNIKVYIVSITPSGKIVVYYGPRVGRPPKNSKPQYEFKRRKNDRSKKKGHILFDWRKHREEKR